MGIIGRLGRVSPSIPPHLDARFLHLEDYLAPSPQLKQAPAIVNWAKPDLVPQMWDNDKVGVCALASFARQRQLWSGNVTGTGIIIPDSVILQVYTTLTGYDPNQTNPATGDNPTDTGLVLSDLYKYLQVNGIYGVNLTIPVTINPANVNNIHWAIDIFMGVVFGLSLPQSALQETQNDQPWTFNPISPIVGGHAVSVNGYNSMLRQYDASTWSQDQIIKYGFESQYVEEIWAFVDPIQFNTSTGLTPLGLNLEQMLQDANFRGWMS